MTLAICALADLHLKQVRVSQGLEAPNSSETSHATYLKNEALFRLETNKTANGFRTDHDAIAALHLLSLSQLSGGGSDWETPFNILCQWLLEKNLHHAEDPWHAFHNLGPVAQLYVKVTLVRPSFSQKVCYTLTAARRSGSTCSPASRLRGRLNSWSYGSASWASRASSGRASWTCPVVFGWTSSQGARMRR